MHRIEELDFAKTELGDLVLRRRQSPSYEEDWIYEVTIDGEFLMSSVVNDSEIALSRDALGMLGPGKGRRVLVGGLGLGYTAAAALESESVSELVVVEFLQPVLSWHEKRLVPAADALLSDPRVSLVHADYFETMRAGPDRLGSFDAILVDIDHSPDALLHARHGSFYDEGGAAQTAACVRDGGVFALWSADPPGESFLRALRTQFMDVESRDCPFEVPHLGMQDVNRLVFARKGSRSG